MTAVIGYWSPFPNQTLELHLFSVDGALAIPGSVALTEVAPSQAPGYYQVTLNSPLDPGCYRSRIYRGAAIVDDGFVYVDSTSQAVSVIDDVFARLGQVVATLLPQVTLSQLTEEVPTGQYRFTASALSQGPQGTGGAVLPEQGVLVNEFTAAARQQLAGLSISVTQPAWISGGFHRPFIRGDSYSGAMAIVIGITEWSGPDLTAADSILLTALRLPAGETQFQWPMTAAATSEGFQLLLELTSEQTDQPAGLYAFDVEARWSDGAVHTLIGPDAQLRILQDTTV